MLEEELDFELLDRTTRPVTLTAAGAVFLVEARITLDQARRAVERGRQASRGERGRLSLGTVAWACNGVVPSVIRAFRARFPSTGLEVSVQPGTDQVEALRAKRLDVGFTGFEPEGPLVTSERLFEEPMVGVVPEGHPLSARKAASLEELLDEPYVCISRAVTPGMFEKEMELLRLRGPDRTVVQEAPDIQALLGLVAAGLGVSLQPASARTLCREGVVFIPVDGEVPVVSLFMLWRRDDDRELLRAFAETAREVAHPSPGPSPKQRTASRRPRART